MPAAPDRAPIDHVICPACKQEVAVMPGFRIPHHGPGWSCTGGLCGRANCPECSERVFQHLLASAGLSVMFPGPPVGTHRLLPPELFH